MPIYELASDELRQVQQTTFAEERVRERQHLQRVLRAAIETVAEDTMVLAEEFGDWESKRRIDLLALDKDANLVVIELKRDEDGAHMELQALRYAAMVSTMTFARAVEAHKAYLAKLGADRDAQTAILEHLGWDEPREESFAQDVSIVLVAANFSTEITSTVMWLNERNLSIRCVRVQPYRLDGRILLDVQQIIPLPEVENYQVRLKAKATESRAARASGEGPDFTRYDLSIRGVTYNSQWKRRMVYLAVRSALEAGVRRDALPILSRKWLVLDGHIASRSTFVNRVRAERFQGRDFEERRWFLDEDDLFHDQTSTFALSNQWSGADVLAIIDRIATMLPELQISYAATATAP